MTEQTAVYHTQPQYQLSEAEKRIIKQYRDMRARKLRRPFVLVLYESDGILQISVGQPAGMVRNE